MALNTNAPYTGAVQYLTHSNGASTPSLTAPGIVTGGTLAVSDEVQTTDGIGGQRISYGGLSSATLTAELQTPATMVLTNSLRSQPNVYTPEEIFIVGTLDSEWTLAGARLASLTYGCKVGEHPTCSAEWHACSAVQTATGGNSQQVDNDSITYNWSDFDVLVNGVDYKCQSWQIQIQHNPSYFTTLDGRLSGTKRNPLRVLQHKQEITLTLELADELPVSTFGIRQDDIKHNIGVQIEGIIDMTLTLTNLNTPTVSQPFQADSGLVVNSYEFSSDSWAPLDILFNP